MDRLHGERWSRIASSPRAAWAAAALVFVLYLPSLGNGFVYDDFDLIVRQAPPSGVGDILQVFAERHWPTLPYYRPVVRLTMVVQQAWHGD